MRLTKIQIEAILSSTEKIFSADAIVYLFGSRVDDHLKGGDIDLMIYSKDEEMMNLNNKVLFLVDLKHKIGEQKIDVVFDNLSTRSKQSFYQSVKNRCICLNYPA